MTGLPSCQEHLLGASGRIHRRSLASLSPGGPFSRLPFPRCAPERWGHPADPVSAWGVSEGMLGSGKGRGRDLVQAISKHLPRSLLCCWGPGQSCSQGPSAGAGKGRAGQGAGRPHKQHKAKHKNVGASCCGHGVAVPQKVKQNHHGSQHGAPRHISKELETSVHHVHSDTTHKRQNVETHQTPVTDAGYTKRGTAIRRNITWP